MTAHLNTVGVQMDDASAYSTARVWLNYNHTGPSINNDFNVSTVTDVGTGLYTANFTVALGYSDFSTSVNACEDSGGSHDMTMDRRANPARVATTTSLIKVSVDNHAGSARDVERDSLIVFGD